MQALELDASIVDHRLDIHSLRLPAHGRARVIVLYEPTASTSPPDMAAQPDVLALARTAQASFPRVTDEQLRQDLAALRGEWQREP